MEQLGWDFFSLMAGIFLGLMLELTYQVWRGRA